MGCENSRLNCLSSQNQQSKPQHASAEEMSKLQSKSRKYQVKENLNSTDGVSAIKEKESCPQSFAVKANDKLKIQAEPISKQELDMIKEAIGKIEEFQSSQRKNRKLAHPKPTTKQQFEDYFNQILDMLKNRKLTYQKVLQSVKHQYASKFNKPIKPEDIERIIAKYFSLQIVPDFEVRNWLKLKTDTLKSKGQQFTRWIKEICSQWKTDKEFIPELLHVLIEDSILTDKTFAIKLAFQYQYKNKLEELNEWDDQLIEVYRQIRDLIV